MKIYRKIVIDMSTGQTVEEDSFEYSGSLALCGGTGSTTSGKVDFPGYMKSMHGWWLSGNKYYQSIFPDSLGMVGDMDAARSENFENGNPYAVAYAYDPTTDLTEVANRYSVFNTHVNNLNELTDWVAMLTQAETGLDSSSLSDDEIEAVVAQFETEQLTAYNRSVNRFNASAVDINAVQGSAFVVGNALLEQDFTRSIAKFRADLKLNAQQQKYAFVLQGINTMAQLLTSKLNLHQSSTHLLGEIARVKTILMNSYLESDLKLSVDEATWDISLYQHGANLLGAIGGGTLVPKSERAVPLWLSVLMPWVR
jgi:hypothetical protein